MVGQLQEAIDAFEQTLEGVYSLTTTSYLFLLIKVRKN